MLDIDVIAILNWKLYFCIKIGSLIQNNIRYGIHDKIIIIDMKIFFWRIILLLLLIDIPRSDTNVLVGIVVIIPAILPYLIAIIEVSRTIIDPIKEEIKIVTNSIWDIIINK